MTESATVHAGCVVVGETGVLIRGPSGSGKSALARELIAAARQLNLFARLVADDRVALFANGGRLIARPVESIAGLIEVRGFGLLPESHEPAARVTLVVDCLTEEPVRYPEEQAQKTLVKGVELPRLALRIGPQSAFFVLSRLQSP